MSKSDNQPIQYKKGYVEFYKLKFKVTPDVLIPRPETELLVDEALRHVRSHPVRLNQLTILDMGTGAGNIAVSLACNLRGCNVNIVATDISEKALKVGSKNAKLHRVSDMIKFIQSDLITNVPRPKDICIIVTNLPYIPTQRIPYLDSSVKDFEPHMALDGGGDGFGLYRKLFAEIIQKGWKSKLLIGEIDYTHGELAVQEAQKYFPEAEIEVKTDLAQKQRILIIAQGSLQG